MTLRSIRIAAVTLALALTLATAVAGIAFVRAVETARPTQPTGPVALYTFDGAKIVKR